MRLEQKTIEKIIQYKLLYFGSESKLYLLGSRVDDNKRGGDINLYLETQNDISTQQQVEFLTSIYKNVTQRKIDLLIKNPLEIDKPIFHTAKKEGLLLC